MPDLLMVKSCFFGELGMVLIFVPTTGVVATLVMYHSKLLYISYVPQSKPLIWGVKMLH